MTDGIFEREDYSLLYERKVLIMMNILLNWMTAIPENNSMTLAFMSAMAIITALVLAWDAKKDLEKLIPDKEINS